MLVVGLGNPGPRYQWTRHNVGFWVVERLAEAEGFGPFRPQFSGRVAEGTLAGKAVVLLEPLTFMNLSGVSVKDALDHLGLEPLSVVVVHDELDLAEGDVRIKVGGGEAGHRGLRSISEQLGTRDYIRVRFGIGRPPATFEGDIADFVLEARSAEDRAVLMASVARAVEAVSNIARSGVDSAMNEVNRRDSSR